MLYADGFHYIIASFTSGLLIAFLSHANIW